MGVKVLLAFVFFIYLTNGEETKTVNNSVVPDNTSAESGPMLYRVTPSGIYASSSPYGAFSFHVPSYREPPKLASQFVPVVQKHAAFIRDSYGNKFLATPQTMAYRTTLPQQYVKLQDLPKHLAKPLVAAAPGAQFPNKPHFSYGSTVLNRPQQIQKPNQAASYQDNQTHPKAYAPGHINSLSAKLRQITNNTPGYVQQQPSNHRAVYSNIYPYERYVKQNSYFNPKESYFSSDKKKFERLKEKAHEIYAQARKAENSNQKNDIKKENLKNAETSPSKQITVTTVDHEGIKTIVTLDTQPPVPQLNLDWLKPLTFDNPIVPQVQHYLPKIEYDLDEAVEEEKNNPNNYLKENHKSYESDSHHPRPDDVEEEEVDEEDDPPPKPHSKGPPQHGSTGGKKTVVLEYENEPEISFEINTPTHKESFNQRSVKYDKKTTKDPVSYSYNTKSDKKPVSYSYSSSSKAPPKIEAVEYEIIQRNQEPAQIIYNPNPKTHHDDDDDEIRPKPAEHREAEDSSEDTSEESDELPPRKSSEHIEHENYKEQPSVPSHLLKPEHRDGDDDSYHKSNHPSYVPKEILYGKQKTKHLEELKVPVENFKPQYEAIAITPEYDEEDIHLLPKHKPHGSIREYDHKKTKGLSPNKHKSASLTTDEYDEEQVVHKKNDLHKKQIHNSQEQSDKTHHSGYDDDDSSDDIPNSHGLQHDHQKEHLSSSPIKKYNGPDPEIHEKSREVIVQDETPDELHSLREHMRAESIKEEENNEEDFDKQYKAAAYGFPAYNNEDEEEKQIYNSDSYGEPKYHSDFSVRDSPLEQYTQGDSYPRSARLQYKDIADDNKEDYVLDYSLSKPQILSEKYKSKADYYKMYQKHKPENFFKDQEKEKRSEKLIAAPVYNFEPKRPKKHTFHPYKSSPKFSYNKKSTPSDSFAFASGPQTRKKTLFVEPQFQYGFEKSALPTLFDSELSASTSNIHPRSEKPVASKKIYKENRYIEKTST